MPTGRAYRLKTAALAIERTGSRRSTVNLSKNEILYVSSWSLPDDPRMISIRWKDRQLAMFASDLQRRGEEITN